MAQTGIVHSRSAAFTLVELLLAVLIVGVITSFSVLTFNAISGAWQSTTDYMDKMQRTDYALNQLVSGLRSMYYPHDGKGQTYDHGFVLTDNGDGQDARRSDVIEWSKKGSAIIGNRSAAADTVHRVQVMVLEEGDHEWDEEIEVTGLYARCCPDKTLRPTDDDIDYTFANEEMYQPVLIADGIVGFNCRVMKDSDQIDADAGHAKFEDEWDASNAVPYKVELTFYVKDPEEKSYRSDTAPVMRIVKIPIYEQAQDGVAPPSEEQEAQRGAGRRSQGGRRTGTTQQPPEAGGATGGSGEAPPGARPGGAAGGARGTTGGVGGAGGARGTAGGGMGGGPR